MCRRSARGESELCRRSAREQSDLCHRSARGESENGGSQCDFRRAKSGEQSEKAERNRCEQSEKAERNGEQSDAKARQSEARSARARSEPRCEQSDERSESCKCVSAPRSTTCCATCGKVCASGVVEHTTDDGDTREAAGKLLCATTLPSLDAAIVTRRWRRMTSFAFPSGGAPMGASLHLRRPLRRRRPGTEYADCTYGSDCADCGPRVPRPPPPMAICTKDCIGIPSHASDGDRDGGGPGAELGTGCCRLRPPRARRALYVSMEQHPDNHATTEPPSRHGGKQRAHVQTECDRQCGPRQDPRTDPTVRHAAHRLRPQEDSRAKRPRAELRRCLITITSALRSRRPRCAHCSCFSFRCYASLPRVLLSPFPILRASSP